MEVADVEKEKKKIFFLFIPVSALQLPEEKSVVSRRVSLLSSSFAVLASSSSSFSYTGQIIVHRWEKYCSQSIT